MTVTHLFLYPVKSLAGISVTEAELAERGLHLDRRWMIVDEEGIFISQRSHPVLASIKVAINHNSIRLYTASDQQGVTIPMVSEEVQPSVQVKVWKAVCDAVGGFGEANIWLSSQLSMKCRIVYMPQQTKRLIDSDLVPDGATVSFADGYPYLLIGSASLADLNSRLEQAVDYGRFRPNIVVQTESAFEEDKWKGFRLGEASFQGVKPCSRCVMVNVDQKTMVSSKEPLRTMATYRQVDKKVKFGLNVIWSGEGKVIRVGDDVVIEQH